MCSTNFLGGWPLIFYSSGLLGIIWSVIWILFYTNSPSDHRLISEIEKDYILTNIEKKSNEFVFPWRMIIRSSTCWALFLVHICFNWGIYTFQTSIPKYLNEVFKFNIKSVRTEDETITSFVSLFSLEWIFINITIY